jgi:hypothetical protein
MAKPADVQGLLLRGTCALRGGASQIYVFIGGPYNKPRPGGELLFMSSLFWCSKAAQRAQALRLPLSGFPG